MALLKVLTSWLPYEVQKCLNPEQTVRKITHENFTEIRVEPPEAETQQTN